MYNDYMYAVDRSDEYLAHYGIKGMKWGVQKAIASGNSNKLARQYKKAQKKLAKLEKRAANGSKYAKRAAALGAGAALAGGAAALGTAGVSRLVSRGGVAVGKASGAVGKGLGAASKFASEHGIRGAGRLAAASEAMNKFGHGAGTKMIGAGRGIKEWGQGNNLATGAADAYSRVQNSLLGKPKNVADIASNAKTMAGNVMNNRNAVKGISNNTIARVGAGALGAGLAAGAAYNAYRAATTKKAAAKAQQFRSEMNKAFAGTKYANGGNGSSGGSKKRRRR